MALRAKFKFETDVFFMILRSKIMKNTSVSKEYFDAAGGKNLFTLRQIKSFVAKPRIPLVNRYDFSIFEKCIFDLKGFGIG